MKHDKLKEGDTVLVHSVWADTTLEGVVRSLLSSQFTFEVKGKIYFCPYNGRWEIKSE